MSEFRRRINRMAGSLRNMLREVPNPLSWQPSWQGTIAAPRTLGSDDTVESLFLAQHFLGTYVDWRDLVDRWSRYFGQADSPLAGTSDKLNTRCRQRFVNGIPHAPALAEEMRRDWTESLANYRRANFTPIDQDFSESGYEDIETEDYDEHVESLVHEIIESDRRARVATLFDSQAGGLNVSFVGLAREFDSMLADSVGQTPEDMQAEMRFYLRNYRHSMLRFTWLKSNRLDATNDYLTLFEKMMKEPRPTMSWLQKFLDGLMRDEIADQVDVQLVDHVLGRIADAVREMGYDDFASDVSSRDFVGGDDSPVGSGRINLIPSKHKGACHPILVAVAKGASRSKSTGFIKIMQQVKTHLINCAGTTRVAIVLCDSWDTKNFMDEHFSELKAHHGKGVRFLFVLAGAPGRDLAAVPVDFDSP